MPDNPLQPIWITDSSRWDFSMAAHLLRRAGFGGTLDEMNQFVALGPQQSVARIMDYQSQPDDLPQIAFGDLTGPLDPGTTNSAAPAPPVPPPIAPR